MLPMKKINALLTMKSHRYLNHFYTYGIFKNHKYSHVTNKLYFPKLDPEIILFLQYKETKFYSHEIEKLIL